MLTSLGVAAVSHPVCFANSTALLPVRFQTTTSLPPLMRLRAMPSPMIPRPSRSSEGKNRSGGGEGGKSSPVGLLLQSRLLEILLDVVLYFSFTNGVVFYRRYARFQFP